MSFRTHLKIKRFLWFVLSAALLLAACDSIQPFLPRTPVPPSPTGSVESVDATSTPTPAASPTAQITPVSTLDVQIEDLDGQILRFWHPWSGSLGREIKLLTEEFNLNNPWGIQVTSVSHPGYDDLESALQSPASPNESPQVVAFFLYQALAIEKKMEWIDLQPYVSDPQWGLSPSEQSAFNPIIWEQDVQDGRRLGIPAFRSGQVLFYNQSWAKEMGFLLPPATPEQFRQQACAAAQANLRDDSPDNDGAGGWIVSTDGAAMLSWIYAFGGDALKSPRPKPNQSVYQFNTAENEQALTFLRQMYDTGCAWINRVNAANPQQSEDPLPHVAFANRLGLFASSSVLDISYQSEMFRASGSQDQWTVIPYPSPSLQPAIDIYGPSFYIPHSSPEAQLAAWLFIRWLSSPEHHARVVASIGAFPVQTSSMKFLEDYGKDYPQWASAVELLKYARVEPSFASWGKVRRGLNDAATQLFRSYFSADQIPVLLDYLDAFAADLHIGTDLEEIFITPTNTSIPGARPTRTPKPSPDATLSPTP